MRKLLIFKLINIYRAQSCLVEYLYRLTDIILNLTKLVLEHQRNVYNVKNEVPNITITLLPLHLNSKYYVMIV